jgi:flagellin-like hook-associated protein FlgL
MAEDDDTFNVIVTNVEYEKMLNDSRQQMSELRTANEKIHSLEN